MNPLLIDLIGGVFKPAAKLIDDLHTSEEEKLQAKAHLLEVQAALTDRVLQFEGEVFKARAAIVQAEAESDSWLTANWRPITMMTFLGLTLFDTFGWLDTPLRDEAWELLKIGLGGYVIGRSAEKVVKVIKNGKGENSPPGYSQ